MNIRKSLNGGSCIAVGLMLLVVVGCGKGDSKVLGTVEGKVTFDGNPVTGAQVMFQSPDTGVADTGRLDAQGNYKVANPLAIGRYLVSVVPIQDLPPAGSDKPMPPPADPADIPAKYRAMDKSGLEVNLVKGKNTFDVKMAAE